MRITINTKRLTEALERMRPIFKPVKGTLVSGAVRLTLDGNDLEIASISAGCCVVDRIHEASGDNGTKMVLNGNDLLSFVKRRKSGEVEITAVSDVVASITFPGGTIELPMLSERIFPAVFKAPDTGGITLNVADCVSVIGEAGEYALNDDDYSSLNHVMIEVDNMNMNVVATDRNRMYVYKSPADREEGVNKIPVSIDMARLLNSYMTQGDERMVVVSDGKKTFFKLPDTTLYEASPEGTFVDWRMVDERFTVTTSFTLDKSTLLSALDDVAEMSELGIATITLSGDSVKIVGEDVMMMKKCDLTIPALSRTGEDLKASVNSRYVRKAVGNVGGSTILVEYSSQMRAFRIKQDGKTDKYILVMSYVGIDELKK